MGEISRKFKPNSTDGGSSSLERGELFTKLESSACGVDLIVNQKYLITGQLMKDHRAHISLCDFIKESSKVTEQQLEGFGGHYRCS
ncbi:metalloproteinase inhibitor 4-like [Brevipalpus obovatus]|uniref:metalloproteinase inhibitor 4-like n=1 Tax=Brevipalpus obovatus TaxID=246614 RepID=UPI003D9F7CCD